MILYQQCQQWYDNWYKIFNEKSKSKPEETITERVKPDNEDLCNMPPLEDDQEDIKLKPEGTIAEKMKLNSPKRKKLKEQD